MNIDNYSRKQLQNILKDLDAKILSRTAEFKAATDRMESYKNLIMYEETKLFYLDEVTNFLNQQRDRISIKLGYTRSDKY